MRCFESMFILAPGTFANDKLDVTRVWRPVTWCKKAKKNTRKPMSFVAMKNMQLTGRYLNRLNSNVKTEFQIQATPFNLKESSQNPRKPSITSIFSKNTKYRHLPPRKNSHTFFSLSIWFFTSTGMSGMDMATALVRQNTMCWWRGKRERFSQRFSWCASWRLWFHIPSLRYTWKSDEKDEIGGVLSKHITFFIFCWLCWGDINTKNYTDYL